MNIISALHEDTDHPIVFLFIFVATIALSTYAVYLVVQDWLATVFAVAVALAMFGLIYYAALDEQPEDYRALAHWLIDIERPSIRAILLAVGILIVGTVMRVFASVIEAMLLPTTESAGHSTVSNTPPGGQAILLLAVMVIFVGPLIEEIVFRGVLQRFTAYVTGAYPAILIAAAVFALGHIPTYGGFGTPLLELALPMSVIFLDSVLWGWLYYRTENVVIPWIAHAGSNALAMVAWVA